MVFGCLLTLLCILWSWCGLVEVPLRSRWVWVFSVDSVWKPCWGSMTRSRSSGAPWGKTLLPSTTPAVAKSPWRNSERYSPTIYCYLKSCWLITCHTITDTHTADNPDCVFLQVLIRMNLSEEEFFHLTSFFDKNTTGKFSYNDFLRGFLNLCPLTMALL